MPENVSASNSHAVLISINHELREEIKLLTEEADVNARSIGTLRDALFLTQRTYSGDFKKGWTIQVTGHEMNAIRKVLGLPEDLE